RRALREPVDSELRAELLAELGHVELHSAAEPDPRPRLGAAVDHLSAAYEGARDAPLLARVAEDLAIAHYLDCAPGQAIRVLDRTAAGPAAGHEDLVDRLAALALAMAGPNAAPAHIERLDRLRAAATHDPDLAIMIAAFNAGRAVLAGRPDEAVIQARRVAAAGRPRTPRRLLDHATAAGVLCCADVLGPAARCATAMIAQGDGAGPAGFAVLGHMLAARVAYLEGRLDDAIDEARIAGGLQFAVNGRAHAGARAWELAALLVKGDLNASAAILTGAGLLGERGTAPPWARDSASAAGGTGGTGDAGDVGGGGRDGDGGAVEAFIDAHFLGARGLLNELRGDHEAALADHIECGRRLTDAGIVNPAFVPWRSRAARVSHRLGRGEAALRLAGEEVALARRWGTPRAVGVALRALGVAAGGADGLSLLEESVALLARSPARVEHAFALYDLGRALGESGRRAEARPLLHESYRLAAGCGARPLAERCAAEIKRVGGRRPRALIAGPAALTAQERRIAERAVAGATNREIAEELFLTLRTVEAHLTGVYRKLGITGRAQLAARLTG
ncbi:MAG TPA: LuxR C-terminal-related transcriptional regulator, partial [Streptosporangiaceae bacterium]|nr:LuxR C-terminal-related transcriptional regulator [Streptosporangiaceae bacterium]